MMDPTCAPRDLVVYSGHGRVVGGDFKYLAELLPSVQLAGYRCHLLLDREVAIPARYQSIAETVHSLERLDTLPRLRVGKGEGLMLAWLGSSQAMGGGIARFSWRGRPLAKWLYHGCDQAWAWLSLRALRVALGNSRLFDGVARRQPAGAIWWLNNGGYPAKYACLYAAWCAKRQGAGRVIMTIHSLASPRGWWRWPLDAMLDSMWKKSVDDVIAVSQAVKEALVARTGIEPARVQVIYCGVADEVAEASRIQRARKQLQLDERQRVLLLVGNLDWRGKGWDLMIATQAMLAKEFPNLVLVLVGGGSKETTTRLERLIERLNLTGRVILAGRQEDVAAFNGLAEIAVIPSTTVEATPYTIKEAARAGKPVVVSDIGGSSESVVHGETGLLVPPDRQEALANAIRVLLRDPERREKMGQAGRALYLQRFTMEVAVARHLELFAAQSPSGTLPANFF